MTAAILHRFATIAPEWLTMRQIAVLTYLATVDGPHTTRSIAKAVGVSKPVITRICNTYPQYLHRRKDMNDLRSVFVTLTAEGREFTTALSDMMARAIEREKA